MICPRWVATCTQPIGIEDVVVYLVAALELAETGNRRYEIGADDQVSHGDIMLEYARQRSLRRMLIPVPFLIPSLSSLWLGLTTPVYARVGRKLTESLKNPTVVRDRTAGDVFSIKQVVLSEAILCSRQQEDQQFAATRWSDAVSSARSVREWRGGRFGSRVVTRSLEVSVPLSVALTPVRRIGGRQGWYYWSWLWHLRGIIDLVLGGVVMRRGRPDPEQLRVGDPLDFWRVEAYALDARLRLEAEMKLPGRTWLEFEVAVRNASTSTNR